MIRHNTKVPFLYLLLLCSLLAGIPLILVDPTNISPDSYQYLSIANYYLFSPSLHIRDAFTVGPVVPLLLALIKSIALKFIRWNPDIDIALLKTLVFICYIIITASAYKMISKHVDAQKTLIVLFFLLVSLNIEADMFSLNGELVCIATISILMTLFQKQNRNTVWFLSISVLIILTIYAKIQSVPILLLLILSESRDTRELKTIAFYLFPLLLTTELYLYINGIGVLKNSVNMCNYIFNSNLITSINTHVHSIISIAFIIFRNYAFHFVWVLIELVILFPLLPFTILLLSLEKHQNNKNLFSDWRIWLAVTIFSIYLPGRRFYHYLFFAIPFILKFSGIAISNIENIFNNSSFSNVDTNRIKKSSWRQNTTNKNVNAGTGTENNKPKQHYKKFISQHLKNNHFLSGIMLILVLSKIIAYLPNLYHFLVSEHGISPRFILSKEADDVRDIFKKNPGTLLVHGWDHRYYPYFNTYSLDGEASSFLIGAIDIPTYINGIIKNNYEYLLDVVNHSGFVRKPKYSLSKLENLNAVIAQRYTLIYNKNGLRLYQRIKSQNLTSSTVIHTYLSPIKFVYNAYMLRLQYFKTGWSLKGSDLEALETKFNSNHRFRNPLSLPSLLDTTGDKPCPLN